MAFGDFEIVGPTGPEKSGRVGRSPAAIDPVDGASLADILDHRYAARQPVPKGVAIELTARLLEAATDIHALEQDDEPCYHGRINASQVMLTSDGGVKLCGFGIPANNPERRSADRLGPAADQAAIGLILVDLVMGRRLALDESLQPSMGRWPRTLRVALEDLDLSDPLMPVLLRIVAERPEDRFDSCAEAARRLRRLRESPGGGASLLSGFASDAVRELRADVGRSTDLDDVVAPFCEWLEGLPEDDSELALTVQVGPLVTSRTLPFAECFTPKAARFYMASQATPVYQPAPDAPSARPRSRQAPQRSEGVSAAPALADFDVEADTTGTLPFAETYAPSGGGTRSVPAWVLASQTAPIDVARAAGELSLPPVEPLR